jgi:hypothetical protein
MKWLEALKVWNEKKGGKWEIPKKGTKQHSEVKALMRMHVGKPTKKQHGGALKKHIIKGLTTYGALAGSLYLADKALKHYNTY